LASLLVIVEILGALGLVLLTLLAGVFHRLRDETDDLSMALLLILFVAFVAYGRLVLAPTS